MIVFLDIDGVLNQLQGNYYLDSKCVENLSILCRTLKASIVLTSSWRLGYSNFGKCSPQIEELKKKFSKYSIKICGRTANLGNRYEEINKYIQDYNINEYIILDDDKNEFMDKMINNLYIINGKKGLTSKDVKSIIKNHSN